METRGGCKNSCEDPDEEYLTVKLQVTVKCSRNKPKQLNKTNRVIENEPTKCNDCDAVFSFNGKINMKNMKDEFVWTREFCDKISNVSGLDKFDDIQIGEDSTSTDDNTNTSVDQSRVLHELSTQKGSIAKDAQVESTVNQKFLHKTDVKFEQEEEGIDHKSTNRNKLTNK